MTLTNEFISKKCILALKDYFSIDKWQINQPIIIANLFVLLDQVEGVQTVKQVNLNNVAGTSQGYSKYAYDMNEILYICLFIYILRYFIFNTLYDQMFNG